MDRASAYEYFKNLEEKKKAEEERLRLEKEEEEREEREEREREKERKTSKKKSSKSETNSFWNKVIIPIAKSFGNQLVRNLMKKMK
jgi:alpha-galactosidase/6-phospho-beta-glucosidase family protein